MCTDQELVPRDAAVVVFVREAEHLLDLCVGDVLGQVRHHEAELHQVEGLLLHLVLLGAEPHRVRLSPTQNLRQESKSVIILTSTLNLKAFLWNLK